MVVSVREGDWPLDVFVDEGWAGSSEKTIKLYTIDGDYLDLLFLSIQYLLPLFPSLLILCETVRNLLKYCPIGSTNSSIPSRKQLTGRRCHETFGTGAFPILTTDRQAPAVLAAGAGCFFLLLHSSLVFGRKYREKIVQHMVQAIVPSPFVTPKR